MVLYPYIQQWKRKQVLPDATEMMTHSFTNLCSTVGAGQERGHPRGGEPGTEYKGACPMAGNVLEPDLAGSSMYTTIKIHGHN